MIVIVYLIIPTLMLVLWWFSREVRLPEDVNEKGISKELFKISLFIYHKLEIKKYISGSQKVSSYLSTLHFRKANYYAHKISLVLLMGICGSFLALLLHLSALGDVGVEDGRFITRNDPGDGKQNFELVAKDEEGNELGQYDVSVAERFYTLAEAEKLFTEACDEMERIILGNNESLDYVTENLKFVKKLEGYPFRITWKTDNYDVIDFEGEINKDNVPSDGVEVTLTASYKYDGNTWQQLIYINIMPEKLTKAQQISKEISGLLAANENETKYEENMILPEDFGEGRIIWSEKKEDNSLLLLLMMLICGAVTFVLKDKELKKKIDDRNKMLAREYPMLISQLVLYLGAGMTMRNIFFLLADNYIAKRKAGGRVSYMYEEIVRMTRELSAGKSETDVYESFGRRCGCGQFTRLSTLLTQNLRKGNSELLKLLNDENRQAFEERLERVRKEGEEAGTKLLLPMILMLLIVMMIIMIPAYTQF